MKTTLLFRLTLALAITLLTGVTYGQKPTLSLKSNKRILTLDEEEDRPGNNTVKLEASFVAAGTKKVGTAWSISGVQDKDWEVIGGALNAASVELKFKKVGNYDVAVATTYSVKKKLKNGEIEEEETDIEVEEEAYITVTNNLDELTQIHADSNFVKLVKKSADYVIKPKFAGDPTPTIFLAKGYYGMYRKDLKDAQIQDPYDEAINAVASAIEMDQNGIFYTPVHKMWLSGFQTEVLNNGIIFKLDDENGYPVFYNGKDANKKLTLQDELGEGIEQYSTITKNPIAAKFLEAAIRFQAKDSKGANAIWKVEIPNLLKLKNIDKFTEADKLALKTGIILSAQILPIIEKNNTNACLLLTKIKEWFGEDKDFIAFYEGKMNSCKEQ
ncbi:MAG: hypothetical protein FGM14_14645 [Flavobacteriales bacterium]|nr:hypothetical protein [Flavobacteriales bacterium]